MDTIIDSIHEKFKEIFKDPHYQYLESKLFTFTHDEKVQGLTDGFIDTIVDDLNRHPIYDPSALESIKKALENNRANNLSDDINQTLIHLSGNILQAFLAEIKKQENQTSAIHSNALKDNSNSQAEGSVPEKSRVEFKQLARSILVLKNEFKKSEKQLFAKLKEASLEIEPRYFLSEGETEADNNYPEAFFKTKNTEFLLTEAVRLEQKKNDYENTINKNEYLIKNIDNLIKEKKELLQETQDLLSVQKNLLERLQQQENIQSQANFDSHQKVSKIQHKLSQLDKENIELKEENFNLQQKIADFETKLEVSKHKTINTIRGPDEQTIKQNRDLQNENQELREQIQSLQKDNNRLKTKKSTSHEKPTPDEKKDKFSSVLPQTSSFDSQSEVKTYIGLCQKELGTELNILSSDFIKRRAKTIGQGMDTLVSNQSSKVRVDNFHKIIENNKNNLRTNFIEEVAKTREDFSKNNSAALTLTYKNKIPISEEEKPTLNFKK